MIQASTILTVIDNSGVKLGKCIKILSYKGTLIGSSIIMSAKKVHPNKKIKKGDLLYGVLVSLRSTHKRSTGYFLKSSTNSVIVIKKNGLDEPIGTRFFKPIYDDIRAMGFSKIASLAKDIV